MICHDMFTHLFQTGTPISTAHTYVLGTLVYLIEALLGLPVFKPFTCIHVFTLYVIFEKVRKRFAYVDTKFEHSLLESRGNI